MSRDGRIAYGARCSWWGPIGDVSTKPSGLPCCPHCGGVLLEVESLAVWNLQVDSYTAQGAPAFAALGGNPDDYRRFIDFARGPCFPSSAEAATAFLEQQAGG